MRDHPMLSQVLHWAQSEDAIRAVVITGSCARGDGSTDAFTDLDVQIITTDIKRYIEDDSWLDTLGEVWIRFPLYEDHPYRLVWFAGGIKVDFQFIHRDTILSQVAEATLTEEYQRGYIVSLDKDGLYTNLPPSPRVFPLPPPPSAAQVQATINEFWFEAIHVAQFIRRREFWVVKYRDWTMKEMLLRLLEWHARATKGNDTNTWILGKRIADWVAADTLAVISQIWTPWDPPVLWRGLLMQLALFRRLSTELTDALAYDYDDSIHSDIEIYIQQLCADDQDSPAKD